MSQSVKTNLLLFHLDFSQTILIKFSDEQGERFYQELDDIEQRFQGKNKINMSAYYCRICRSLEREIEDKFYKRETSFRNSLELLIFMIGKSKFD